MKTNYDIIIIGGGINGSGIALDAVLRGYSCALFEKGDFSSGATSKSTRLIHGGLRYLETGQFSLVYEALREREWLLKSLPHLVKPLRFILPVYTDSRRGMLKLRAGMLLYNIFTLGKKTPWYTAISKTETLKKAPLLKENNLIGSAEFYDAQIAYPERLVMHNIITAKEHGLDAYNYHEVTGFIKKENTIAGVKVKDTITKKTCMVKAKIIANAAGPWVEDVLGSVDGQRLIRTTKGTHIIVKKLADIAVYTEQHDGRMVFLIPWNKYTLIGTTDTDYKSDLNKVYPTQQEINYLIEAANNVIKVQLTAHDVLYSYAGIRPLAYSKSEHESDVPREHKLMVEKSILTVIGGKLTTYRSLAEEAVDRIGKELGENRPCKTKKIWIAVPQASNSLENHLISLYGERYKDVLKLGTKKLCPNSPECIGQLKYGIKNESVRKLEDFMMRRTALAITCGLTCRCYRNIAEEMGKIIGWSKAKRNKEIRAYENKMKNVIGQNIHKHRQ